MGSSKNYPVWGFIHCALCLLIIGACSVSFGQTININGTDTGRLFEGLGACDAGTVATLLVSYPEPQRSQILDLLFKPKFGASMTTYYAEVGGDGNSTQSTTPSHMRSRTEVNCQRGWTWFMIREAKKRNPEITLDATAWNNPGWVTNGNSWSQDMCNYYCTWIKGLKANYGYDLDAVGCRNEPGDWSIPWVKMFKKTLVDNGLSKVKLHAFDNWKADRWDFVQQFSSDQALRDAVDVISVHIPWISPWSEGKFPMPDYVRNSGKPLWDTEEHPTPFGIKATTPYEIATVIINASNSNYIAMRMTKTIFWSLIEALYPQESYFDVTFGTASQPWSGHYTINAALWAYAHYNQFVKLGWQYLDGACGNFGSDNSDGTYVTLKSPDNKDFSVIIETKGSRASKAVTFNISGGLPSNVPLCVWLSNPTAQFIRQPDITPVNGSFTMTIAPNSIYSISTTTGQQKGSYPIPAAKPFPLPYYETYDHYTDLKKWGYMPYYNVDPTGVFEVVNRPDGAGKCLRQVVDRKAEGWVGDEWAPSTVLGDDTWTNYEVSVDVSFDSTGWAGVMGRVTSLDHNSPKGYYLRLAPDGAWGFYAMVGGSKGDGNLLNRGQVVLSSSQWHNLKLQFNGSTISGFIENKRVFSTTNSSYSSGMAGLVTAGPNGVRCTALFDNLIINTLNGPKPRPTVFSQDATPPYPSPVGVAAKPVPAAQHGSTGY